VFDLAEASDHPRDGGDMGALLCPFSCIRMLSMFTGMVSDVLCTQPGARLAKLVDLLFRLKSPSGTSCKIRLFRQIP
jgi:hypothetical protein